MSGYQRLADSADIELTLDSLDNLEHYQQQNSKVFASVTSLRWFIRVNRAELLDAGALVQIAGRVLIDGPRFTQKTLEIGRRLAVQRHA